MSPLSREEAVARLQRLLDPELGPRVDGLEVVATAASLGIPLESVVYRPVGECGGLLPAAVRWTAADGSRVVVGLARDSIAEWLPPGVVGSDTSSSRGSEKTSSLDQLLREFISDSHMLFAAIDDQCIKIEAQARLQVGRLEDPYADALLSRVILRAFGLGGGSGAELVGDATLFDDAEVARLLRLLPYLNTLRGSIEGAELALRVTLGCLVRIADRQVCEEIVPDTVRTRLGWTQLGGEFILGGVCRSATGYRVVVGPGTPGRIRSLRDPAIRAKIAALVAWLLPAGGGLEVVGVVAESHREFRLGDSKKEARLGLTTWIPLAGTARVTSESP